MGWIFSLKVDHKSIYLQGEFKLIEVRDAVGYSKSRDSKPFLSSGTRLFGAVSV